MRWWFWISLRSVVVIAGVVMLTSFTIDATDALNGSQSALSLLARKVSDESCPAGMDKMQLAERALCVDQFENSFTTDCPHPTPSAPNQTQQNVNDRECRSQSREAAPPATYVTFHQAKHFCAVRGGRLPTAGEWFEMALGTPDSTDCNIAGGLAPTGEHAACISARGAYDMIGNAWEWVDATVTDRQYANRALPASGYVQSADGAGIATETSGQPVQQFNADYFWSADTKTAAMLRGGFFQSNGDGGLYATHADVAPSFTSEAIGFRCVQDVSL